MTSRALILAGDGINCEKETAQAAQSVGYQTQISHINDLILAEREGRDWLSSNRLLVIPGGFSFGDELGSGQVLALKLKHVLGKRLFSWIENGGLVLGICNGFQVLVRLGVFGDDVVLAGNSHGRFINRWITLNSVGNSVFTKGLSSIDLPIRHGEGRLLFSNEAVAQKKMRAGECVLQYSEDVNGAWNQIAALSAFDGRVLGLMPHPEAFWTQELHPEWTLGGTDRRLGTEFFRSSMEYLKRTEIQ